MNARPEFQRIDWILVGSITLLAVALRVPYLDSGIWFDEILTYYKYVRTSAMEIIQSPFGLNNHLLHTLAARASVVVFGESTWALRLPAFLFGVASVPALYYFCRQLDRRDMAALSSLFLAVSYHHVWFSQNARGYTGLALGAILASILLVKILKRGQPDLRLWALYVLVAVLSSAVHLLGSLVIIAHAIVCFFVCWPDLRRLRLKWPLFLASLFVISGLITVFVYTRTPEEFIEATTFLRAPETQIENYEEVVTETQWYRLLNRVNTLDANIPGGLFSLYVVLLVMLAGIRDSIRRGLAETGIIVLPIVVTVGAVWVLSSFFLPRFFFACAPFMIVLASRGGFALAAYVLPFLNRRHITLAGCLVAALSAATVPLAWKPKQDFEGLARFLEQEVRPGDAIACMRQSSFVLTRHLRIRCSKFVELDELKQLEQPGRRMFVVMSHLGGQLTKRNRAIPVYMSRDYDLVRSFPATVKSGDIDVYLWDVPSPD